MTLAPAPVPDARRFAALRRSYRHAWAAELALVGPDGERVHGLLPSAACRPICRQAVAEALRWGAPAVQDGPADSLLWAVPVTANQAVLGGLVAWMPAGRAVGAGRVDVRAAGEDLLQRCIEAGWTNAALLAQRRGEAEQEGARATAIRQAKRGRQAGALEVYVTEEPALLAALRRGDLPTAREVLNRVLVVVYGRSGDSLPVLKSCLLELVVSVNRTVAEVGRRPTDRLGAQLAALAGLESITDEVGLAKWLRRCLDDAFAAIARPAARAGTTDLDGLLPWIEANAHRGISRAEAARRAGLSPGQFSRRFATVFGASLPTVVNRLRIGRAQALLTAGGRNVLQIALDCGFADASHFAKVFRRHTGVLPGDWRSEGA
jgi:AraC-like DNA-binding protein